MDEISLNNVPTMITEHTKEPIASPLFSLEPIVKESKPPIVVIGLPRSGSSFLSHILSCTDDLYIFDDLYLLQRAQGLNVKGALNPDQLHTLVEALGWTVRARIKHERNFTKPQCTWEDVDRMVESVKAAFANRPVYWHQLMEEWMTRLAIHHGRSQWGYKTPQDFMHMDMLVELFPGIKFIFIVRHPVKMMSSMKYVHPQDGNPNQYHPVAYALYWKMAYKRVQAFIQTKKAPVYIVKFEDLVKDPNQYAKEIAAFLDTSLSKDVPVRGNNTSFASGERRDVTPTEAWICRNLTKQVIHEVGYDISNAQLRIQDIPDLVGTSFRFLSYQIKRVISRSENRSSVVSYLKSLLGMSK